MSYDESETTEELNFKTGEEEGEEEEVDPLEVEDFKFEDDDSDDPDDRYH